MAYPINLVDIAGIAIAVACVKSSLPDVRGMPRKLWRLGLPPLLGIFVSMLILAGAVVSFDHDATWMATALCGSFAGWLRGRHLFVETDQIWGVVRTRPAFDTVVVAVCILAIVSLDGLAGLFKPGTLPRHAEMAATSALCAGYLTGRAWSLVRRAMRSPHVELEKH